MVFAAEGSGDRPLVNHSGSAVVPMQALGSGCDVVFQSDFVLVVGVYWAGVGAAVRSWWRCLSTSEPAHASPMETPRSAPAAQSIGIGRVSGLDVSLCMATRTSVGPPPESVMMPTIGPTTAPAAAPARSAIAGARLKARCPATAPTRPASVVEKIACPLSKVRHMRKTTTSDATSETAAPPAEVMLPMGSWAAGELSRPGFSRLVCQRSALVSRSQPMATVAMKTSIPSMRSLV